MNCCFSLQRGRVTPCSGAAHAAHLCMLAAGEVLVHRTCCCRCVAAARVLDAVVARTALSLGVLLLLIEQWTPQFARILLHASRQAGWSLHPVHAFTVCTREWEWGGSQVAADISTAKVYNFWRWGCAQPPLPGSVKTNWTLRGVAGVAACCWRLRGYTHAQIAMLALLLGVHISSAVHS